MNEFDKLKEKVENIKLLIEVDTKSFQPYTYNLQSMLKEAENNLEAYNEECQNAHEIMHGGL